MITSLQYYQKLDQNTVIIIVFASFLKNMELQYQSDTVSQFQTHSVHFHRKIPGLKSDRIWASVKPLATWHRGALN